MSKENFEITSSGLNFIKRPIKDIIADSKTINVKNVSEEILKWVIANVESFIDNHTKIFKLDLVMDGVEGLAESKRLQDLYRAIPDDEGLNNKDIEKAEKCRRTLDEIVAAVYTDMTQNHDKLKELFDRMIFYYERVIPSPENKRRALEIDEELKKLFNKKEQAEDKDAVQKEIVAKIKEGENLIQFEKLEGAVSISKFEYEAFSVGLMVKAKDKDSSEKDKIVKETVIPEGFTLWLELSYKTKQRPTVMF